MTREEIEKKQARLKALFSALIAEKQKTELLALGKFLNCKSINMGE